MKKRMYFIGSLLLAIAALVAQAAVFYFVLLVAAQAQLIVLTMSFGSVSTQAETIGYGQIPLFLLLTGLLLAILSLVCAIQSYRRREPGGAWQVIPLSLLTVYS